MEDRVRLSSAFLVLLQMRFDDNGSWSQLLFTKRIRLPLCSEQRVQATAGHHGKSPRQRERREDPGQDEAHRTGRNPLVCNHWAVGLFEAALTLSVSQVDVMKEAYSQGVESEVDNEAGGDQILPRDVGHNIYILAHQVSPRLPSSIMPR